MADPENIDVTTGNFDTFFADVDNRRLILELIQERLSYYDCGDNLSLARRIEWENRILDKLLNLTTHYQTFDTPELRQLDCDGENNNDNIPSVGPLNQAFIGNEANFFNNGIPVQNIGTRFLPMNAENTIMGNAIVDGDEMVNFQDEFGHGRYYKRSTYNSMNPKRNPYNPGAPITALRQYRAIIGGPPLEGGERQKSKRTKRRMRKHRRRTIHRK